MKVRRRLDAELVRRGLATTRTQAQEAIESGRVIVDGAPALKAATQVEPGQALAILGPARPFVSRGGQKLCGALDALALDVAGLRCLDAGASTGGFTDCLLRRGAAHVTAVDVGYGQLHDALRRDPRVTVLERVNVRDLTAEQLPTPSADLLVADLSFISLRLVLPTLRAVVSPHAHAVVLVKPQFEAGRKDVGKGGVVRDPDVWKSTVLSVAAAGEAIGWGAVDVVASPLLGPAGNVEFFLHLAPGGPAGHLQRRLAAAVAAAIGRGTATRPAPAAQPTGLEADGAREPPRDVARESGSERGTPSEGGEPS